MNRQRSFVTKDVVPESLLGRTEPRAYAPSTPHVGVDGGLKGLVHIGVTL
jgi:hypothetical protein